MLSWRALSAASTSGGKDDRYSAGGAAAGEADVAEVLAITGKVERPMYALRGCSGVGSPTITGEDLHRSAMRGSRPSDLAPMNGPGIEDARTLEEKRGRCTVWAPSRGSAMEAGRTKSLPKK